MRTGRNARPAGTLRASGHVRRPGRGLVICRCAQACQDTQHDPRPTAIGENRGAADKLARGVPAIPKCPQMDLALSSE